MKYTHVSVSKTGLRRYENEDSFGVFELEDGLLTVLCDGLGGNRAGEVASSLTVETIYNSFTRSDKDDYLERIKDAIMAANKMIMDESSSTPAFKGMATTVEVLFLNSNTAYWGHIGDSRIYKYKDQKIKQLTKDHSLVQRLVDEGYLTLKEAENHPNRNIIMKALGDTTEVEADLSKLPALLYDWHVGELRPYEAGRDRTALELYARYNTTPRGIRLLEHRMVLVFRRTVVSYYPVDGMGQGKG